VKILAATMGQNLDVFMFLVQQLRLIGEFETPALYITNAKNYLKAKGEFPSIDQAAKLFEWDLVNQGRSKRPHRSELKCWQAKFPQSLWNAVVADRRLFFGKYCKYKQDYIPRFSEPELLGILSYGLEEIEKFVLHNKPDLILSFGTATFGDYIFELIATLHNVRFLQLKSTKVQNRMHLGNTGFETSRFIRDSYQTEEFSKQIRQQAIEHIESTRASGVKYEGAIILSRHKFFGRLKLAPLRLVFALKAEWADRSNPLIAADNHVESPLVAEFHQSIVQPLRTLNVLGKAKFLEKEDLADCAPYIFYPMHFEPEVSIQVFGKSFQNQIDVVRNLALSAPLGTKLLVKEHPRSVGFRKWSYYKKLLDIPNVELVNPFLPSLEIVKGSDLVAVISGSIGLEAVICGKPTLVFGKVPYQMLPQSMVHSCRDYCNLDDTIADAIANHEHHEECLIRYFSAIISHSVPVNFYTELMSKSNRHSSASESAGSMTSQYRNLAVHLQATLDSSRATV